MYQKDLSTLPSNLKFGLFFLLVFLLAGLWSFLSGSILLAYSFLFVAICFGFSAVLLPHLLTPLNIFWATIGQLLGKIMGPFILGVFFYFIFTPMAVTLRLIGRDSLRIHQTSCETYWVDTDIDCASKGSFKDQY